MTDNSRDTASLEQSVLGACLLKHEVVVQAISLLGTTDEAFGANVHKVVWNGIVRLHASNTPVDPRTLIEDLHLDGTLKQAGGASYIAGLMSCVPTTKNADAYAKMLRNRSVLSAVQTKLVNLSEKIKTGLHPEDVQEGIRRVEQHLAKTQSQEPPIPVGQVLPKVIDTLNTRWDNTGLCDGVPSGFDDLDKLTGGFHGGDLIIVGARTSIGKTAFALAVARNVAKAATQRHVVFYSLEMSAEALTERLLGAESGTSMRVCHAKPAREAILNDPAKRLSNTQLFVQDFRNMNSSRLTADLFTHIAAQGKPDLILIDYVQYMSALDQKAPRHLQISEITKSLKAFAREHDVPVVLLSQINRSGDEKGAEPSLANLKESSAIEEDADMVIILTKDFPDSPAKKGVQPHMHNPKLLLVNLAKNRNGPVGKLELTFNKDTQEITGTRLGFFRQVEPGGPGEPDKLSEPKNLFADKDTPFDEFDEPDTPEISLDTPEISLDTQQLVEIQEPVVEIQEPPAEDFLLEPLPDDEGLFESDYETTPPAEPEEPINQDLDNLIHSDDPKAELDGYPINSFVRRIYETTKGHIEPKTMTKWAKIITQLADANEGGLECLDTLLSSAGKNPASAGKEEFLWQNMTEFATKNGFDLETGKPKLEL